MFRDLSSVDVKGTVEQLIRNFTIKDEKIVSKLIARIGATNPKLSAINPVSIAPSA